MIRILIPAMGKTRFFEDSFFPKQMIEINGTPMIEHVIQDYSGIADKRFVLCMSDEDCNRFHVDDSVRILTGGADIVRLSGETEGALCTCLMAIEFINNDDALIIGNCDQVIDIDYQRVIAHFESMDADAGVIVFPSIHPRWSYAKLEGDYVVETAEKRPLSQNAIAGLYYFKRGRDFVDAAKNVILKDNRINQRFYISASLNEMILDNKKIAYYQIPKEAYHSFYSPEKIREYEEHTHES